MELIFAAASTQQFVPGLLTTKNLNRACQSAKC